MAIEHTEESLEKTLLESLRSYLSDKFEKIVKEESEEAAKRIRNRMREEQDKVFLSIFNSYTMERMGRHLRVTIQHVFEEEEEKKSK